MHNYMHLTAPNGGTRRFGIIVCIPSIYNIMYVYYIAFLMRRITKWIQYTT